MELHRTKIPTATFIVNLSKYKLVKTVLFCPIFA